MREQNDRRQILIKAGYWMGIVADAIWALALVYPRLFGLLTGRPGFEPDSEQRLVMGIAASLMTGWTLLLLWAVRAPIERRAVILITAFPVVFGMFVVALVGVRNGNTSGIWILGKTSILMVFMVVSYFLSGRVSAEAHP